MEGVTIYHNPRCSKSRETLQLIRDAGIEPVVIEYLLAPPDPATLAELVEEMGLRPRALIRDGEEDYVAAGLADPALDDEALLLAMSRYPRLINRPIVRSPLGTRLCRPPELVLEVLPQQGLGGQGK